jgi:hypothetical protein
MSHRYEIANPRAAELLESLRAFGYDLPTAIADLIDNSIAARAQNVWIDLHWNGKDSRILIRDDGTGMDERRLVEAMRPGSVGPLAERHSNDLGRFGLGLKTASISQCRRLTVLSKTAGGATNVCCWDLDYIRSTGTGEWRLLKGNDLLAPKDLAMLAKQRHGTVIFWDNLDQLVGEAGDEAEKHFRQRADQVRDHLAMVFHRFLSGRRALTVHLNDREIEPWDPFLEAAPATDPQPEEALGRGASAITVKPFVLPHHSKLSSEMHAAGAGPRGWNAHQGFYVYRNRRLLVAGDWLGLGMQQEEHFKLARIRIDMANTADLAWQIDVKKARARPPSELRNDLIRIAKATRARASAIYRHRGHVLRRELGAGNEFLWKHLTKHGKSFYKINRDHPLVAKVLSGQGDRASVRALVALVEQTIPTPLIVIKNAEAPDTFGQPFEDSPSELQLAMKAVFEVLTEKGVAKVDAGRRLVAMEPFDRHPGVVAAFLDTLRD